MSFFVFSIFHFSSFSFIFYLFFVFFLSFSLSFCFHCLCLFFFLFLFLFSFSIIFYRWFFHILHFLSFSFILFFFVGCSKSDLLGPSIWLRFLLAVVVKKNWESSSGEEESTPLGPLFLFSSFFFSRFCPFFAFYFFSFFVHFFHFLIFLMFFICFSFFLEKKVSSFLFFQICFIAGIGVRVWLFPPWSVLHGDVVSDDMGRDSWDWVGPPAWREHASTPQSGVGAPRLLKRSLSRMYYCCWG